MRVSDLDVESESGPSPTGAVEEAADFQSVRSRLFGIAYRILGRITDAEDVVQDVWIRWNGADQARVRDRIAFLVTITTRVALNVADSARARREVPVDRWLPERVHASDDPTSAVERSADLKDAVQLLLARLPPAERAVFVLREAFAYPFRDIAEVLGISEANARQLARRARKHIVEDRQENHQLVEGSRLFQALRDAARLGDVATLQRVLVDDVPSHSGRHVRTPPLPLVALGSGP